MDRDVKRPQQFPQDEEDAEGEIVGGWVEEEGPAYQVHGGDQAVHVNHVLDETIFDLQESSSGD